MVSSLIFDIDPDESRTNVTCVLMGYTSRLRCIAFVVVG